MPGMKAVQLSQPGWQGEHCIQGEPWRRESVPLIERYLLERAAEAHEWMRSRRAWPRVIALRIDSR